VLSGIPLLNFLNCCFCLLNMAGAAIGISMYLKANPNEKISNGDAAMSGAISGALAGLISGIFGFIVSLALGSVLVGLYRNVSPELAKAFAQMGSRGVASIVVNPFLYAGFGALGGFLSMQFFFKDRLKT
jgi:hypothetical protein